MPEEYLNELKKLMRLDEYLISLDYLEYSQSETETESKRTDKDTTNTLFFIFHPSRSLPMPSKMLSFVSLSLSILRGNAGPAVSPKR